MKQLSIIFFASVLTLTANAQGFFDEPSDDLTSKIENPTYLCQDQGALFAFDTNDVKNVRIWQADPGDKDGLELEVLKVNVFRCAHCYDFEAEMSILGTTMTYDLKMEGISGAISAFPVVSTLSVTVTTDGETVVFDQMDCRLPVNE